MVKRRQKKPGDKAEIKVKFNKINKNTEKEKILLMRIGVVCVMAVFFIAWIFNLKYQFKINSNNSGKSSFGWEQAKAELNKTMSQIKEGINEIKKIQATAPQNTLPGEPKLTAEQIDLLKGKLMNEAAASTTASGTVK